MRTQIEKLVDIFRQEKDRTLVEDIASKRELSYEQVQGMALKLAEGLSQQGYKKGDKIGIILHNGLEYVVIYFALMQLGAVAVPVNPGLHLDEIKYILNFSEVKFIFFADALKGPIESIVQDYTKAMVTAAFLDDLQKSKIRLHR